MKRDVRLVFSCAECGYRWLSPWYEPTWFGKRMAVKDHAVTHDSLSKNWDDWADFYRNEEQERIIKLLEPIRQSKQGKGFEEELVADTLGEVIALIKGENK